MTLTAAATLKLAQQTEGFTITGSAGIDSITAVVAPTRSLALRTTRCWRAGGTDTLQVGANFDDTGDGQITGIENVTLTAAATLNLAQQTEGFIITGSAGIDSITAGGGADTIIGAQNDTLLAGGGGTDTLQVGANFDDTGDGQITGIENVTLTAAVALILAQQTEAFTITGSSGADTITGGSGADSISAGDGNDINGAQNDTLLAGGNNTDTLQVGVNFDDTGDGQITGIENVTLTAAVTLNLGQQTEGFTIAGSSGNDIITGSSGADTINAGAGNDIIVRGANDTSINGGANSDNNLLTAGNRGDVLVVDGAVDFTALADVFEDIETISMLAADGSTGNSTITLNITDVLDMATRAALIRPAATADKTLTQQMRSALMAAPATCSTSARTPEPGSWQRAQREFRRATRPTLT